MVVGSGGAAVPIALGEPLRGWVLDPYLDSVRSMDSALIVGSVDTRMAAHVQGRKEDPADIARAGLDALDRGEHVADTDFMAIDARARYARDPLRYERGMTKLLKATTMDTGR